MSNQATRSGRSMPVLALAIATSVGTMLVVPPLGYLVLVGWAIAAWVRHEAPVVKWVLTVLAVLLVVGTALGWAASTSGGVNGTDQLVPPIPRPASR
jgi:hypothetical protein